MLLNAQTQLPKQLEKAAKHALKYDFAVKTSFVVFNSHLQIDFHH